MRRSTRNTTTLILDLVTLTPAAVPLPAYYARLRTLTRESYRRVASTRLDSPRLASDRFCFPARTLLDMSDKHSLAYVAARVALGILSNVSSRDIPPIVHA